MITLDNMIKQCSIDGCEAQVTARGWCRNHYMRWYLRGGEGDPAIERKRGRKIIPLRDRFWSKVEKTTTCWNWIGAKSHQGYGQFTDHTSRSNWPAHRLAYELAVGPIPDGLQLDHLCRNRACVRPDHLEPVDAKTQASRRGAAVAAQNTHCRKGHPYDLYGRRYPNGNRYCGECNRVSQREFQRRRAQRIS